MNLISVIRNLYLFKNNKKSMLFIFIIIIILIGILTYKDIYSILPIIISIFYTIAIFNKNPKVNRIIVTLMAFIWIFYNYKVGAYTPIIGNIFEILFGMYAINKYDKNK